MDNENNTKREIPQELPDELLASLAAGSEYIRTDDLFLPLPDITQGCTRYALKPGSRDQGEAIKRLIYPCKYCKYCKEFYRDMYDQHYKCCTYPEDYSRYSFLFYTGN